MDLMQVLIQTLLITVIVSAVFLVFCVLFDVRRKKKSVNSQDTASSKTGAPEAANYLGQFLAMGWNNPDFIRIAIEELQKHEKELREIQNSKEN